MYTVSKDKVDTSQFTLLAEMGQAIIEACRRYRLS